MLRKRDRRSGTILRNLLNPNSYKPHAPTDLLSCRYNFNSVPNARCAKVAKVHVDTCASRFAQVPRRNG